MEISAEPFCGLCGLPNLLVRLDDFLALQRWVGVVHPLKEIDLKPTRPWAESIHRGGALGRVS